MSETPENLQSDDLRRHSEDPAEGAEPAEPAEGDEDRDVPREHSEDAAEG